MKRFLFILMTATAVISQPDCEMVFHASIMHVTDSTDVVSYNISTIMTLNNCILTIPDVGWWQLDKFAKLGNDGWICVATVGGSDIKIVIAIFEQSVVFRYSPTILITYFVTRIN